MRPRVVITSLCILLGILWLVGFALPQTESTESEAYVVQAKETIASIAADYGIAPKALAQFNKLNEADTLQAGQILLIPIVSQLAPQGSTYSSNMPSGETASAETNDGNKITGTLAKVTVKRTEIRSKPNGGDLLYDKATQGTELLVIEQTPTHYGVLMSNGAIGWVPRLALTLTDDRMLVDKPVVVEKPAPTRPNSELVDTAFEYMGIPYKLGGTLPRSVDCSLLVQTVFRRHGLKLPRTAAEQFRVGKSVQVADLTPGDRLYFYAPKSSRIGHTGMYIGDGQFIHASSNRGCVAVDYLATQPYSSRFAGARR